MDESTQGLLPCHYYRFCKGLQDPAQPAHGNLCPDCFSSIDEGYEQVEQEEQADQLATDLEEGGRNA